MGERQTERRNSIPTTSNLPLWIAGAAGVGVVTSFLYVQSRINSIDTKMSRLDKLVDSMPTSEVMKQHFGTTNSHGETMTRINHALTGTMNATNGHEKKIRKLEKKVEELTSMINMLQMHLMGRNVAPPQGSSSLIDFDYGPSIQPSIVNKSTVSTMTSELSPMSSMLPNSSKDLKKGAVKEIISRDDVFDDDVNDDVLALEREKQRLASIKGRRRRDGSQGD